MKPQTRNLARFFALMLTVLLALPALYNFYPTTAATSAPAAQDNSRADVPAKAKKSSSTFVANGTPAPANDNCANAIAVTSCPFTDTQNTSGATDEMGEPQSTCTSQGNSVWYSFTSPNPATVTVSTCTSNFDTAVMVWRVDGAMCDFANFTPIACNDDACGDGFQSKLDFIAAPGVTYKIQVGGFDAKTGSLTVDIDCEEIECPLLTVNGALGNGSPDWPSVSGQQTPNRIFRDGIPSTCQVPKTCPGTFSSGSFTFDAYTFTNETDEPQCVRVAFEPNIGCNANAHAIAYLGSYNPTNLCQNYLADVGSSDDLTFSFIVPAGSDFVIAIVANNPGGVGNGCNYRFTVLGNICEQFDLCIQDDATRDIFQINTTTGDYQYTRCRDGFVLNGTGALSIKGSQIYLQDYRTDRRVTAKVDGALKRGSASVQYQTIRATLTDRDITNNSCQCPN